MAFEDLPESWKCPVCDQPKACTKYDDPTDVGGLDENNGRDENFENEDSWAECQEHDADDWQGLTYDVTAGHVEFTPRSDDNEEPRRAYVGDYEEDPPAKKIPVNGGRLGLMREIRPENTGKGPDNDGRHLGPNENWTGGWSKPNAPCIR